MKFLSLIVVGAMLLIMPAIAEADIVLGVSAQIDSGTSMAQHQLLACNGYNFNCTLDPWTQPACYSITAGGTSLTFGGKHGIGPLTNRLYDTGGADIGGAGCFYAANFYIVYLFPDAWGGAGYEVSQSAAAIPSAITDALIRTPVYSQDDQFEWPDGTFHDQGPLNASEITWNPQITDPGTPVLARNSGLILRSNRARIVRAEYGIPPNPADGGWCGGSQPAGWECIPLTTAAGTYSANITITMTEW